MSEANTIDITVLVPSGILPLDIMGAAQRLASEHGLKIYLSNAQNLRLMSVPEDKADSIKEELKALGADFKGPGKFPIPRVCVGKDHCKLALVDTAALSDKILDKFQSRPNTKAKFKIAIAACGMSCSDAKTTDIGIIAMRDGYDVYTGGKGGGMPQVGRRIVRNADENSVLEIIEKLVEYHDVNTEKKQRINKLLAKDDFPYGEVE